MKLTLGLLAAFAGCSAATQPAGQVFTFPSRGSSSTPALGRGAAHLVFLQRLASSTSEPSIHDIPTEIDADTAVSLINTYGREIPSLFDDKKEGPRRLLVMLEGMTQKQMQTTERTLQAKPVFSIIDPPSTSANEELFEDDFYSVKAAPKEKCKLGDILIQKRPECWNDRVAAVKYNVESTPAILDELASDLKTLGKLAKNGEIESTVVFIPTADEVSHAAYWSDASGELRRRQSEQVISTPASDKDASTAEKVKVAKAKANVVVCYDTKAACEEATDSCSSHGTCFDRYNPPKDEDEDEEGLQSRAPSGPSCFICKCAQTRDKKTNSLTSWGGATCAKQDISTPFWLLVSISVVLVLAVTMSIGLLFSVGEEKLPGVIGAGVSKK